MEFERIPGYDDVYAFIDSQFLDVRDEAKPDIKKAIPARARPPIAPVTNPALRSAAKEPPPVPASDLSHSAAIPVGEPLLPTAAPEAPGPVPSDEHPLEQVAETSAEPIQQPKEFRFIPPKRKRGPNGGDSFQMTIPNIEDYLPIFRSDRLEPTKTALVQMEQSVIENRQRRETRPAPKPKPARRLKRPELSGPRPRKGSSEAELDAANLPESLKDLAARGDESVLAKYYSRRSETRQQTVDRIVNPELSLEETARLLGVCPTTVRRYTNRGWLRHHRTQGNQRRFRLSDITDFLQEFGREKKK